MLRSAILMAVGFASFLTASAPGQVKSVSSDDNTFWAPAVPPRAHYEIDCDLDPAAGLLKGTETIRFTNPGKRPLSRLAISWPLGRGEAIQVTQAGTPVKPIPGTPMLLDLPQPLKPDDTLRLEVRFQHKAPAPFRGPFAVVPGWYPRLTWGYRTHDDFTVRLHVPAGFRLAAGAAFDPKTAVWRAQGVSDFRFVLWKDLPALEADAGGVKVAVLHTEKGRETAQVLINTAVDAIRFFQERFGFYPHPSLIVVPGADEPVGGYPNGPAVVVVHGQERFSERPLDHWRWITAHEIGHMYWSEHVFAEGPDILDWLMIGLGIYCDREYSRARGMTERHQRFLEEYVGAVRDGYDTTVDRTPEHFRALNWDYNNKVIHAKGFSIISALESVVGAQAFDRVHARALREYAGRRFSWRDLRRLCEEETGQDLEWFFQQWVRSNRYLSYEVTGQQTNGNTTSVRIRRSGTLEMPVPIEAVFEDGSTQRKFTDRLGREQTLEFTGATPLRQVRLDPQESLPLVVPPPDPAGMELTRRIREVPYGSGDAPRVKDLYQRAAKTGTTRVEDWTRLGLLLYDTGQYAEALEAFGTLARLAGSLGTAALLAAVWQGHVLDLAGKREEALAAYREALSKWPQDFVLRHDQWGMRIDRKWVEDRQTIPFARK